MPQRPSGLLGILTEDDIKSMCSTARTQQTSTVHLTPCNIIFTWRKKLLSILDIRSLRSVHFQEGEERERESFFWCILQVSFFFLKRHSCVFRVYAWWLLSNISRSHGILNNISSVSPGSAFHSGVNGKHPLLWVRPQLPLRNHHTAVFARSSDSVFIILSFHHLFFQKKGEVWC